MFGYLPFLSTACRYDPETSAGSLDGVWSTDFVYSGRTRSERFEPHAGTSMAAPHVAGVAALMRAVDQRLDAHAFMTLIASGAITNRSDGDSWDPQLGFGIIDARKAVDAVLLDGVSVASAVLSSPALLSFGEVAESRVVRLSPSGAGAGFIDGFVNNGHGWLRSARPLDVDANGFGYWEIGVDRQGLVEGLHLGAFTVRTSTDVEATIQADIRVGPPNLRGDAGFLYLGLFDALTGELVDLVGGSGFEGQYSYTMTGIVTGSYFLISFSDVSFSRKLCSPGNLCGFFPGTGPIEPLIVQAGRDNRVPTIVIQPDFSGLGEASAVQAAITADSEKQKSQSMVNWFSVPLNWPQLPVSRGALDGTPVFGSDGPGMSNIFPVGTWERAD